jgi:hypothetical protein
VSWAPTSLHINDKKHNHYPANISR